MRNQTLLASAAAAALTGGFATAAASPSEWFSGLQGDLYGVEFSLSGDVQAFTYDRQQPKASTSSGTFDSSALVASGMATLHGKVEYHIDPQWAMSLNTSIFLHDGHLTTDDYGGNVFQKVYGRFETPLGDAEIGMTDGAAATLAVDVPVVDRDVSVNNPHISFFEDTDNTAFIDNLRVNTTIRTTYNYSKFSYYTPKLYGFSAGFSYTPAPNRDILPYTDKGTKINDLDVCYWEAALNYNKTFGGLETSAYIAGAFAPDVDEDAETNHLGMTDWAFGSSLRYTLDNGVTLSAGGAFHRKNTYYFYIASGTLDKVEITSLHLGTTVEWDKWSAGVEYGDGMQTTEDINYYGFAAPAPARSGVKAYGLAVGYKLNRNVTFVAGLQDMRFDSTGAVYYNGKSGANMQAAYVKIRLSI